MIPPVGRDLGMRLAGIGLLAIGAGAIALLGAHAQPGAAAAFPLPVDYALAAIVSLGAAFGLALLAGGAALFKPLEPPLPACRCRDCNRLRLVDG